MRFPGHRTGLRQILRSLRRAPSFTIAATLTLAIGIGATVAIFSVVNAVLLRPLPFFQADRLVGIHHALPGLGVAQVNQSLGSYFYYRKTSRLLSSIAGYTTASVNIASGGGTGNPRHVSAARISANLLATLHVSPAMGRGFTEAEDRPNGGNVVLISDALWHRRFAAERTAVGATLRVNGASYEVIGVLPSDFHFPERTTQLWLPLALDPATSSAGGFNRLAAIGRLRPGATRVAAQSELERLLARLPEAYPNVYPGLAMTRFLEQSQARVIVHTMHDDAVGGFARVLWILAAAAALVLVVTCANVANLVLVRMQGRTRELAVRAALGASRWRLLARSLAEGLVLAALGGTGGLALAVMATRVLVRLGPSDFPRLHEVRVDGAALAFTAAVAMGVALVCSALPAVRYRTMSSGAMLRDGGRSGRAGRERRRAQRGLIIAQVAVAFVLLAGSGLLVRTVRHLRAVHPGFDASNTVTLSLSLPTARFPHATDVARFYSRLVQRVRALPGVQDAGVVSKLPLAGHESMSPVSVEHGSVHSAGIQPVHAIEIASAGYFRAMRIPVVAGSLFGPPRDAHSAHQVMVSRAFAERYWHDPTGRLAIGERVRVGATGPWSTITGVVESVRDTSIAAPPLSTVYFPLLVPATAVPDSLAPRSPRVMTLVVHSASAPAALTAAIRGEIRALDPSLPAFNVQKMTEVVARSTARTTFVLIALATGAAMTLLLGATGLYGVIAYVVALRTHELGLRMALGAQPAGVRWLVLRQGLGLTVAGVLVGLAIFTGVGRVLSTVLFEVAPTDPITLLAVSAALVLVAAVASWLPARRAARIDPLEALRAE